MELLGRVENADRERTTLCWGNGRQDVSVVGRILE